MRHHLSNPNCHNGDQPEGDERRAQRQQDFQQFADRQARKEDGGLNNGADGEEKAEQKLLSHLDELKANKPLQYVLGYAWFYGLKLKVDKHVLIPRPETEELVRWILEIQNTKIETSNLKILDIGTGSGCIAISLAKNIPNSKVFAIDVSEGALATAKKNALRNGVEVTFLHKNI